MLSEPTQIATDLDVQPTLAALRYRQTWGWLPGQTHDWNRMQMQVDPTDDAVAPLLHGLLPEGVELRTNMVQVKILYPFGVLPPHSDPGRVALHVVLMTNDQALFTVGGGKWWHMPQATAWVVPIHRMHSAMNNGRTPRIHLVAEWYE